MRFNKPLLCNCINVRYSLLTFCVMYAKVNEARVNSGYTSIFLRIYGRWKILFSRFWKIDFSSFKMTFAKSFIYKVLSISFIYRQVFKVLKKFYYAKIFDTMIAALRIFFAFYTKFHIIYLSLSLRCTTMKWIILSFVLFWMFDFAFCHHFLYLIHAFF